jgi:uncharacterized protein YndB with AHSA1/START domain
MADLIHEVTINAPTEKVHAAITTQAGLKQWWTDASVAEPRVGTVAEFGFFKRKTVFRMKIEELLPQKIVWSCVGGPDEWVGTRLTWHLSPRNGATRITFRHGNWKSTDGDYGRCNSTWGALMYRLKDYVEGNPRGPHFTS